MLVRYLFFLILSHIYCNPTIQKTKDLILGLLSSSGLEYSINGDLTYGMPNTINISFKGVNSEALMLATRQFCAVSNGSACNSHSYKPSHVLTAMGLDSDRIESAIRISWGVVHDISYEIKELIKIANCL